MAPPIRDRPPTVPVPTTPKATPAHAPRPMAGAKRSARSQQTLEDPLGFEPIAEHDEVEHHEPRGQSDAKQHGTKAPLHPHAALQPRPGGGLQVGARAPAMRQKRKQSDIQDAEQAPLLDGVGTEAHSQETHSQALGELAERLGAALPRSAPALKAMMAALEARGSAHAAAVMGVFAEVGAAFPATVPQTAEGLKDMLTALLDAGSPHLGQAAQVFQNAAPHLGQLS